MRTKRLCWSSFGFVLLLSSACSTISIPDSRVCAVSGVFAAGADCATILSGQVSQMTVSEFLDFLEPLPEHPDPNDPTKMIPARGAAICQSAEDWNLQKTALEQACAKLGTTCDETIKKNIAWMVYSLKALQAKIRAKALPLEQHWRPEPGWRP